MTRVALTLWLLDHRSGSGGWGRRPRPLPIAPRAGAAGRVHPAVLGRGPRPRPPRSAGVRPRRPLLRVCGLGRRVGRAAVRPRHPAHRGDPLPALRPARAGGGAESPLPRRRRIRRRRSRTSATRSRPRCWRRCRSRPTKAGGCWSTPRRSSCATPPTSRAGCVAPTRARSALDAGRSGFHAPRIKSFPQNTEIETIVTFAADNPGLLVNNVTPDGRAFTLRIHHSFLRAPEGYTPRRRRSAHRRQRHRRSATTRSRSTRTPRCSGSRGGGWRSGIRRRR